MTQQEILQSYQITQNMSETARNLKLSEQTVKRVLITNGIYPSERAKEVARLRLTGMTVPEISEYLKITEKIVLSNLPYTKGSYATGPKSENAEKIAKCRANKKAKSQKSEDEI